MGDQINLVPFLANSILDPIIDPNIISGSDHGRSEGINDRASELNEYHLKRVHFTKTSNNESAVLYYGHDIDEGLLNHFDPLKVKLSAILTHPVQSLLSDYISQASQTKEFDEFIESRNNILCQFFIRSFPSFIKDPLSSFKTQCKDILEHFDNIYFLDEEDPGMSSFFRDLDLPIIGNNTEDPFKNISSFSWNESSDKGSQFLIADLDVYYELKFSDRQKNTEKPKIESPHYWYVRSCDEFIKHKDPSYREQIILNESSPFLKDILRQIEKGKELDLDLICRTALSYSEEFENFESMINLQQLLGSVIGNSDALEIEIPEFNSNVQLHILLDILTKEKPSSLKDIKRTEILSMPHKGSALYLACARIYLENNDHSNAEDMLMRSLSLDPLCIDCFVELYNLYASTNKRLLAYRSLEKCLEIQAQNKEYKKLYLKSFKYLI